MRLLYIILLLLVLPTPLNAQNNRFDRQLDSIMQLRELSGDKNISINDRLRYAKIACSLSYKTKVDSTILKSNRGLSFIYLSIHNEKLFGEINYENLFLSQKLDDSLMIAYSHENLGWYYTTQLEKDSAYYHYTKASKLFKLLNYNRNRCEVLLNMATLQESEMDYTGCETNILKALSILEVLPSNENNLDNLCIAFNTLAIISYRLKDYDKAIIYFKKALKANRNISDNFASGTYINKLPERHIDYLLINNNIALSFREKGDYNTSINLFNKLLNDKALINTLPEAYAVYLNNLAYTKFLKNKNSSGLAEMFQKAYRISDTTDDPYRMALICNNMAEFYYYKKQKDSALFLANKAYQLSRKIGEQEENLKSLKLLSDIKGGDEGKAYLDEYIRLSDSLINRERAARNKFARIEFETDQVVAENKKISRERQVFMISSIGILAIASLLYIILAQRSRNRRLVYNQQQQQANEEIYKLILAHQSKLEEGRLEERDRISGELHDNILGKLFGTRVGLGLLELEGNDDAIDKYKSYVKAMQHIEKEIRDLSHDLKQNELSARSDYIAIIRQHVKHLCDLYDIDYEVISQDDIAWEAVDDKIKVHLFRIIQEAVQNTLKHAKANNITITFSVRNDLLNLTIKDNGVGFDAKKTYKGIGLKNIRSRAQTLGGKCVISSGNHDGTTIATYFPLTN